MARTFLGPELFRQGMDLYFSRHDGQAVTTEDFIQAMADVSKRNFTQFFRWYRQSGTPRLEVAGKYDPAQQTFTLKVKQTCPPTPGQPTKEPFDLPLAVGLVAANGNDLPLQLKGEKQPTQGTKVLEINQPEQEFVFIHVDQKPTPSLLRNFSAPVKLNYPYTLEELSLLMIHDSDVVARWDAAQQFAVRILLNLERDLPEIWAKTFSQLLADKSVDLHLLIRLFTLPTEAYLAQSQDPVLVEKNHSSRELAKQRLAIALEQQFLTTYQNFTDQKPYVYNNEAMGRRSVKNLCLAYLVMTNQEKYADLAVKQFQASDNMTDWMGALWALNNYPGNQRTIVLEQFYQKWRDQPLVVNKWLALQASSQLPDTLARVKNLLTHPAFSLANPNNVYNLVGAFAGNMMHFHAADGSGYQFIADQVIAIDPKNPQVAARTVEPLTRWRRMDKQRQQLMIQQLRRVQANPKISKDVYELVTKSLTG